MLSLPDQVVHILQWRVDDWGSLSAPQQSTAPRSCKALADCVDVVIPPCDAYSAGALKGAVGLKTESGCLMVDTTGVRYMGEGGNARVPPDQGHTAHHGSRAAHAHGAEAPSAPQQPAATKRLSAKAPPSQTTPPMPSAASTTANATAIGAYAAGGKGAWGPRWRRATPTAWALATRSSTTCGCRIRRNSICSRTPAPRNLTRKGTDHALCHRRTLPHAPSLRRRPPCCNMRFAPRRCCCRGRC